MCDNRYICVKIRIIVNIFKEIMEDENMFYTNNVRKGFTLAEMLITIVIIGIVAMLVIPQLVSSYKRKVAGAKLKKFYYTVNEALAMAKIENGKAGMALDRSSTNGDANIGIIDPWYRKNVTNYMKTTQIDGIGKSTGYFRAAFADGSGFNSYMGSTGYLAVFYCLNFSKCIDGRFDGESQFVFEYSPGTQRIEPWTGVLLGTIDVHGIDGSKASCLQEKVYYRHGCTQWIALNGWEIPKDYPWIK